MSKKLLIFGCGEIAELAFFYFSKDTSWEVHGFICDDLYYENDVFMGLPCIPYSSLDNYPCDEYAVHVALSYSKLNRTRQEKYQVIKDLGYELPSYVSSKATVWSSDIGDNCFILEDQTIQPTVKIGNNVMLWSGNHIGHGSVVRDHVYIASHAVISGHCDIGERTFIGVNSTVKDFTKIGADCFIGMGVNVTQTCSDGSVILPAKSAVLSSADPLAIKIKQKYFGV